MSLRDYARVRDHFDISDDGIVGINAELAFPCCCCLHHDRQWNDHPCIVCDHNANAKPWEPNARLDRQEEARP